MSDDIDFRQAMRDVRPLKKDSTQPTQKRGHSNHQLRQQIQQRAHHSATLVSPSRTQLDDVPLEGQGQTEGSGPLFFSRHGVQKKVLRDLKKGTRYRASRTLDLHGLTQLSAQQAIDRLLVESIDANVRCVLIIHGKGLRSPQQATLKTFTARYLTTRTEVQAYCSAQASDGGTGALYVLLKN